MAHTGKTFLLSPASCSGQRAKLLFNERADFFLARQLRSEQGATLGEVFSFLSGLYFRGKLTYARAFARAVDDQPAIAVITPSRGLVSPDTIIQLDDLQEFAAVSIDVNEPRYCKPLTRAAAKLAAELNVNEQIIFLGSLASKKYVLILHEAFGERLVVPSAFIGCGDLRRGSMLLSAVDAGIELEYMPVGEMR
jgi:hypothetical protein